MDVVDDVVRCIFLVFHLFVLFSEKNEWRWRI